MSDAASSTPFDQLIAPTCVDAGHYTIDIPDGWQQGRGAFGGIVLAIMTRAAEHALGDEARQLRSLASEIVGPVVPGPTSLAVEVLRAGSGVTTQSVRLVQAGAVMAHATFAFGKSRETCDAAPSIPAPSAPPWREVAVAPIVPPLAPVFAKHIEFRVTGRLPFQGPAAKSQDKASPFDTTAGWVRMRNPGERRDIALTVALIDTFWPALLGSERGPRPLATLTFSFQPIAPLEGLDPEAPLFYRSQTLAAQQGYAIEARELWGEDMRLLALNYQTIVVMR